MTDEAVLTQLLYDNGASLAGFADISCVHDYSGPERAVSIAVALETSIIKNIRSGPDINYFDTYHAINRKLDELALLCEKFLKARGYSAFAQTTDAVQEFGVYRTKLPHKTAAVRAGLGWIGKCALLVTEKYGSAVRLTSVLTDAPLTCASPVTASLCGDCMVCRDACPGKAVSGINWTPDTDRDKFFDPLSCRKKARELSARLIDKEITLCGKCIYVCPYTQRYLNKVSD